MEHDNQSHRLADNAAIMRFRRLLPESTATAHAIDRGAPLEDIAHRAVEDGYIDEAVDFAPLVDACVRQCSS